MSEAKRSGLLARIWAHHRRNIPYQVGFWLDKIGCALLSGAPSLGRLYAKLIAPRGIRLERYPGWTFGAEYYIERTWASLRRGVLLEHALDIGSRSHSPSNGMTGCRVDVMLGNDHSLCLYVSGTFEPNEFVFLGQILKPGMTVLDVGANEGLYTLFSAKRVGATGRVVAFEPSSRERRKLQQNVARNRLGNVTVVPVAIGSSEGTAALQIASGVHSGHNTLGALVYEDAPAVGVEHVPVERLDSVVDRLGLARSTSSRSTSKGPRCMCSMARARRSPPTGRCFSSKRMMKHFARRVRAMTRCSLFCVTNSTTASLVFSPATGGVEPMGERFRLRPPTSLPCRLSAC